MISAARLPNVLLNNRWPLELGITPQIIKGQNHHEGEDVLVRFRIWLKALQEVKSVHCRGVRFPSGLEGSLCLRSEGSA